MLFQPSMSGVGRVELYNMRDIPTSLYAKSPLSRRPEKRVRLCDCLSITLAQEEVCPPECSAFLLSTTQRCYTLASDTCQDWVCTLSQVAFQTPDSLKSRGWREEVSVCTCWWWSWSLAGGGGLSIFCYQVNLGLS